MKVKYILVLSVVLVTGAWGVSHAENLNFMRTGEENGSIAALAKDIKTLESSISLSQIRLEEMKKEFALRVSKLDTAAGQESENKTDHFLGH